MKALKIIQGRVPEVSTKVVADHHSLAKHYQPLMRALYGLEDVQGAVGKYFMVSI